ncbi:THAP domain-containing protein 2-like [Lytechinus variegatus]|uniref:THAP domain-containing protein 2-like n=1 Tax=Lytechinus variegatus TaxID=7654 RepID=UPI001BB0E1C4|nr:THAP domain-containing protein 2-like [Lytechinus variegatus]
MVNMKQASLNSSKSSVLCSDYFEDACFDWTGQTIRLRQDAAPTIFDFPPRLKNDPNQGIPGKNFDFANNLLDTAKTPVPKSSAPSFLEDHYYSIPESPRGVKWKLTPIMDCY